MMNKRLLIAVGTTGAMLVIGLVPGPVWASAPPDRKALRSTLNAVHKAGMYGAYSAVRDGGWAWSGAAGLADVRTGRPVWPGMEHRVGSITKTFTAAAVLREVERGRIRLDAPIGRYLPGLVPGERGRRITVRMLLNHTGGIADFIAYAFPSLSRLSPESLDAYRFRTVHPVQLAKWGLQAPPTHAPGAAWSYSNTGYVIAGLLLEKVTGVRAETYITRQVIRRAGLKHTYFPAGPKIRGPHSRMYESLYGAIRPPRDYSVYNMSWAGVAGALVSTMGDLNVFYRRLLTGKVVGQAALAQMRRTVPVRGPEGTTLFHYGLGLYAVDAPCGRFWGHDGAVFGAGTQSLASPDGRRQISVGVNLTKYHQLDDQGIPKPHPIDAAMNEHLLQAGCGTTAATTTTLPTLSFPLRSWTATP